MIRRLLLAAALAALPGIALAGEVPADAQRPARGAAAEAAPAPAPPEEPQPARPVEEAEPATAAPLPGAAPSGAVSTDDSIERWRTPFDVLSERVVGEASRSVRFDWRNKAFGVGAIGSQLLELNSFSSERVGGFARMPFSGLMGEVAATWVFTRGSESTRLLALTPYRQAGRPSRLELDLNVGVPLAEGVATAWPSFFPATELVFSAVGGLRYRYYLGELYGAGIREIATALISPSLTERELKNLEPDRLPGMQLDSGRYDVLAGLSLDVYFASGGFVAPRVMLAVPVFAGLDTTAVGWWWELSLGLGWMF